MPQYNYDWGYSKAYIELMSLDTTVIHYNNKEDEKQEKLKKIEEAKRVYMKRKAEKERQKQQDTLTIKLKD